MRQSVDVLAEDRSIWDGYDYELGCWVTDGIILDCGHPAEMKAAHCCNAHRLAGRPVNQVSGHEVRP